MGRHKQFERDHVLEAAIDVFSRKGFEATVIQDLVNATGLNRSSIYAEFISKQGLFDDAVTYYIKESVSQKIIDAPRDEPLLCLLRRVLDPIVEKTLSGGGSSGCLVIEAITSSDDHSSPLMQKLRQHITVFEANLYSRVLIAQDRGEISRENDAMALARAFISGLHGLRVSCRVRPEEGVLRDIVNQLLNHMAGRRLDRVLSEVQSPPRRAAAARA